MNALNTRTILVIDSRRREQDVFFATATADTNGDIVLRYASGGFLPKMDEYTKSVTIPFAVLVMGEYSARSSAGHAGVIGYGGRKVTIVGGLGRPFGKGGLRRLRRPISGTLMPAGCTLHRADGNSSSNCASATAALDAARFMAELDREAIWLTEGQSDITSIQKIKPAADSVYPEFNDEHQRSVFDPCVAPVKEAVWALCPPAPEYRDDNGSERQPTNEEKTARRRQYLAALVLSDWSTRVGQVLPEFAVVREDHGDEAVAEALKYLLEKEDEKHEYSVSLVGSNVQVRRTWTEWVDWRNQEEDKSETFFDIFIENDEDLEVIREAFAAA